MNLRLNLPQLSTPVDDNNNGSHGYGAISPLSDFEGSPEDYPEAVDDDASEYFRTRGPRWSILEKLENRHYCRIRSCRDCQNTLNCKCLVSTIMLGFFVVIAISFMKAIFSIDLGPSRYDFIVVGAGPAGSVMTRSLVDKGASVLLLEAGTSTQYELGGATSASAAIGGPISRFDVPLLWSSVTHFPEYLWQGFNLPEVLLGKGLGGCGVINPTIYLRAVAADVMNWNIPSWTWEKVLETYIALEDYIYNDDETSGSSSTTSSSSSSSSSDSTSSSPLRHWYHGQGGMIPTAKPVYVDQVAPEFIQSAINAGVNPTDDFNAPDLRQGVGYYHFNIYNGIRASASSILSGITLLTQRSLSGSGMQLETEATVRRVILMPVTYNGDYMRGYTSGWFRNHTSGLLPASPHEKHAGDGDQEAVKYKAVGVEYEQHGVITTAYLKSSLLPMDSSALGSLESRNVILTAGAIMTPKILMNSGIGPRGHLEKAGIQVLVDSPKVGQNLQDHPVVGVIIKLDPSLSSTYPSVYSLADNWGQYVEAVTQAKQGVHVDPNKFGVLGSAGLSAGAFLCSPFAINDVPDIQLTVYPKVTEPHIVSRALNSQNKTLIDSVMQNNHMLVTVALLNADARYRVEINTTDPTNAPPIILSHGEQLNGDPDPQTHSSTVSSSAVGDRKVGSANSARRSVHRSNSRMERSAEGAEDIPAARHLTVRDAAAIVWGIERVREIVAQPPLAGFVVQEVSPGSHFSIRQDLASWVHDNYHPSSNWACTASMGTDMESVLDDELRVRGVKDLRVADASAIPKIPNGGIHATVLMIAARAAQMIIGQTSPPKPDPNPNSNPNRNQNPSRTPKETESDPQPNFSRNLH